MDKINTTVLSPQLAEQLVSRPPTNDKEKDELLQTLQQIERLTAPGVECLVEHFSQWRLGLGLPFDGVKEFDLASLEALFASGWWFSLGFTNLTVEQAKQLASLSTRCSVSPTVDLKHLDPLPYEIYSAPSSFRKIESHFK